MKLLHRIVLLSAITGLLTGCANESPFSRGDDSKGTGGIKVNIMSSGEIETGIPKVRSGETYEMTPPPSNKFQIRLAKTDGTYAQTWSSIDEFVKETEFSIGAYEIEAYYGEPDSQGFVNKGESSYAHSYYYGKVEDIIVKEGEDTEVSIFAELANAAVIVEYTEEFKKYFLSWSTTLQTDGKEDVEIGDNEGMSYVTPGTVDIVMSAVLQNGNSVFLNPAKFEAEPRNLYKITYNVHGGNVQDAVLEIIFNDNPEEIHPVEVPLGEVGNPDPPKVTASGFTDGQIIESQTGITLPTGEDLQFNIIARGGIKNARLKINPITIFTNMGINGGEVDLCEVTEAQKSNLINAGIIARGLYEDRGQMANLNITEFCKNLPEGSYDISFQVTDNFDQVSGEEGKPVSLKIVNEEVHASIIISSAVFGDGYADLTVSYDGPDPTQQGANPLSFQMRNAQGSNVLVPVDILSIRREGEQTRSYEMHNYIYRVSLPSEAADSYYVNLYFNSTGAVLHEQYKMDIAYPSYEVEYDAFATKLKLRIKGFENDYEKRKIFTERLRLFIQDREKVLIKDSNIGIMILEGLSDESKYTIKTTLKVIPENNIKDEDYLTSDEIFTEEILEIPNGNFNNVGRRMYIEKIQAGGKWAISGSEWYSYTNWAQIDRYEPESWLTLNDLTFFNGKVNNTWFRVPSTYIDNGSAVVRSVGYHNNGVVPDLSSSGSKYYCTNTPSSLDRSVGKLILGEYSDLNNSEIIGIDFTSRPKTISFDYEYSPLKSENAIFNIILYGDNNSEIINIYKEIEAGKKDNYTVDLDNYEFNAKAKKLYIEFISSNNLTDPAIYIPTNGELNENISYSLGRIDNYIGDNQRRGPANANLYNAVAIGSELKITNLKVKY